MDWDKIEQLLGIVDKARQWPTLRAIHDAAMAELIKHALGTDKMPVAMGAMNDSYKASPETISIPQPTQVRRIVNG